MDILEGILDGFEHVILKNKVTISGPVSHLLWYVLDCEKPDSSMPRVQKTLEQVVHASKPTDVAVEFYRKIETSNLDFAEQLLWSAVEHENDKVVNGSALKAYIRKSLIDYGLRETTVDSIPLPVDPVIHYLGHIRECKRTRLSGARYFASKELKENLIKAATTSEHRYSRGIAYCALVYLGVGEAVPAIRQRLREVVLSPENKRLSINENLWEIRMIGKTLQYLTGEDEYENLVTAASPRMYGDISNNAFVRRLNTTITRRTRVATAKF